MEPPPNIFIANVISISKKTKIWKFGIIGIECISSYMQYVYTSLDDLYAETQYGLNIPLILVRCQALDNDWNIILFQLDHKHWAVYGNMLLDET